MDAASVVARARRPSQVVITSRIGEVVELATPNVRLRFINDGLSFHPRNTRALISGPGGTATTWRPGDEPRENLGGTLRTLDGVRGPVDVGNGVLSRDGWFLLDDSHSPVLVDGWPAPRESVTGGDPEHRDWYLFAYGLDYHAALRSLAALTGAVALPPRALLGSWYSRFWPYTADDFKEIVSQYTLHGFGLDVLVLDMDWHKPGWTGWSWNRELIPDPRALLAWLRERGLSVTLNLHPADGVGPHEDRYPDFMRALGADPATGAVLVFDPGDRRYMNALCDQVLGPLHADGADFWWLDWQQHHYTPSLGGPGGLSNLRQLNAVLARDAAETGGRTTPPGLPLAREARRRPAILSRWAGWGDQLHPVHFSGDAHAGWRSLAFQVPFTVTSGNVLCCFWSHDIGGHFGARDEECVARWVQFGALSGALRLHSARSSLLDRRPWTCAPIFADSMRRAFALRSTLMPTIYAAAHDAAAESAPLLRPMYFDHPSDDRAYGAPQQYMLGDLLVAPITAPGLGERRVATQRVWFPPSIRRAGKDRGDERVQGWYDWFTGQRFEAEAEAIVAADIDRLPLFAPAGVPILLADPNHPMGSSRLRTLTIRVFPVGPRSGSSATLYEDDGKTAAYLDGGSATTLVNVRSGRTFLTITIEPTRGSFDGQLGEREYIIELPHVESQNAEIDGEPAPLELVHALASGPPMSRVRVPARPITRSTTVRLHLPKRDMGHSSANARLRRLRDALGESVPETNVRAALARLAKDDQAGVRHAIGFDDALAIAAGLAIRPDSGGYRLIDSHGFADLGRFHITISDDAGGVRHTLREQDVDARPGVGAAIDDPSPPLATPPLGVRASRIIRAAFASRGEPMAFETRVRTRLAPVQRWRITGPFPFDDQRPLETQAHGPERGVNVHWRDITAQPGIDGFDGRCAVDLTRHANPGERLYYAVATVRAPHDIDATLQLESADRLEAWLNGVRVFSMDPGETMDSSRGAVPVSLLTGPNELLLKVTGGGGGFGFTAAFEAGVALDDHPL